MRWNTVLLRFFCGLPLLHVIVWVSSVPAYAAPTPFTTAEFAPCRLHLFLPNVLRWRLLNIPASLVNFSAHYWQTSPPCHLLAGRNATHAKRHARRAPSHSSDSTRTRALHANIIAANEQNALASVPPQGRARAAAPPPPTSKASLRVLLLKLWCDNLSRRGAGADARAG